MAKIRLPSLDLDEPGLRPNQAQQRAQEQEDTYER